jgi:hypothetical protein
MSLRGQGNPDLVPAAEGHLQRRGSADPGVERDCLNVVALEEAGSRLRLVAGEIEIDALRRDDRAVYDARAELGDPPHPRGRDRVRLDVEPVEAESENALGDLFGDHGRADREHDVAGTDKLLDRPGIRERGGPRGGRLASILARPEDFSADCVPDGCAHLAGEEQPDPHKRSMREPPRIRPFPSSNRTQALPLPS